MSWRHVWVLSTTEQLAPKTTSLPISIRQAALSVVQARKAHPSPITIAGSGSSQVSRSAESQAPGMIITLHPIEILCVPESQAGRSTNESGPKAANCLTR